MLKIDSETMTISMTRSDTADIVFGAVDEEGNAFHPTAGDRLIFSAAKKVGDEPLIAIVNEMSGNEEDYWTVRIEPYHTKDLSFGKYVYDVQVEIRDSNTGELEAVDTIIGKTDKISPYLVLWGEVSKESE